MRLFALSFALTTLVASPLAAEEKGSWTIDLEATPNQRLGFAYYVSDKFSLRPSLGGGCAGRLWSKRRRRADRGW